MPYSKTVRPGVVCLAVSLMLLAPTAAAAATTTAQLRVVNTAGATLADQSQVTGDVTINTDPGAVCFGPPGGSGANVNVPGPSALGIVKDASNSTAALRPLSVTDQFGFGLGVCGIGGFTFSQAATASWYLKVNHVGATVGGDQYILKAGDEVLWYLSPGFPVPERAAAGRASGCAERPAVHGQGVLLQRRRAAQPGLRRARHRRRVADRRPTGRPLSS